MQSRRAYRSDEPGFTLGKKLARVAVFIVALTSSLIPFHVAEDRFALEEAEVQLYLQLHGYRSMSSEVLSNLVHSQDLEVFWAGPVKGAEYFLDTSIRDRISISYIFVGENKQVTYARHRVISTYRVKDGFKIIAKAVKTLDISGASLGKRNIYFYYEEHPNNVYFGIRGRDLQIEIYDADAHKALAIASTLGSVRKI